MKLVIALMLMFVFASCLSAEETVLSKETTMDFGLIITVLGSTIPALIAYIRLQTNYKNTTKVLEELRQTVKDNDSAADRKIEAVEQQLKNVSTELHGRVDEMNKLVNKVQISLASLEATMASIQSSQSEIKNMVNRLLTQHSKD